jgi:hypothetical protein
MNIFILDEDPKIAAQYNCDAHTVSQVKEIAQMLVHCFTDEQLKHAPLTKSGTVRKKTHANHPCSIFVRQNKENLMWALQHGYYLDEERLYRSNYTKNAHWDIQFFKWVEANLNDSLVPDGSLTKFAIAIAEDKKCRNISNFDSLDIIQQYQLYYVFDKPFATFKKRGIPDWFAELKQIHNL